MSAVVEQPSPAVLTRLPKARRSRDDEGTFRSLVALALMLTAVALPSLAGESNPNPGSSTLREELFASAAEGNVDALKRCIEAGAPVNARGEHDERALRLAVRGGHIEAVKVLIAAGGDVNALASHGTTDLMMAAYWGRTEVVRVLLEAGARVDTVATAGSRRTALMYAAVRGHGEIAKVLLKAGADPCLKDGNGRTAAVLAADWGHETTAALVTAECPGDEPQHSTSAANR